MIILRKMSHVIVLGRNCSSVLGVVRALGQAGHTVDLIYNAFRKDGYIVSKCKYIHQYQEISIWNDDVILNVILSHCGKEERCVLFSTDDHTAELIGKNVELLKKYFILPEFLSENTEMQMENYMRKDVQIQHAEKCGLQIAQSWVIQIDGAVSQIPKNIPFPCFSKPLVSVEGRKDEIGVCNSLEQLEKKIGALKEKGKRALLVQELLSIDDEYVMEGVCAKQEIVIPAVIKKTCVAQKSKGVTLSGYLMEFTVLPEMVQQGIFQLLKEIQYIGMFDLELIVSEGKIYFGEINFRSGGPSYIYPLCGVNLPDLAVKAMMGETIEKNFKIDLGKTFVNDKVLWEDFAAGYIGYKKFKEKYYHSDFSLVRDEDDSQPGILYERHMIKHTLKQKIKKLILK